MITKRSFFKRLGVMTAALVVCPKIGLDRWTYADFTPGVRLRQAVLFKEGGIYNNTKEDGRKVKTWGEKLLIQWFEANVPPRWLDGKKILYQSEGYDYGYGLIICGSYQPPIRPIF